MILFELKIYILHNLFLIHFVNNIKKEKKVKMKLSQFLLISVQSVLFLIVTILSTPTVESTTLIFRRSHEKTIHVGNVISSPMVRCREGYHLDHRRKCRPIVGTFFPTRRPK